MECIRPGAAALLLCVICPYTAAAADTVVLRSGSVLRGRVTAQTESAVSIRTRDGMELTLPMGRVRSVTTAAGRRVTRGVERPVTSAVRRRATAARKPARLRAARPAYENERWLHKTVTEESSATIPLVVQHDAPGGRCRYYFWFFGYVAKSPYEREIEVGPPRIPVDMPSPLRGKIIIRDETTPVPNAEIPISN